MADKNKSTSGGGDTLLYVGIGVGILILIGGGYLVYSKFFKKTPMPAPASSSGDGSQYGGGDSNSQYGMGGQQDDGLDAQPEPYIDPSMLPGGTMPNNLLSSSNISVGTPPSGLVVGSVSGNSAVLSWQPVSGATSYTVQYQASTDPGPTSLSTSGTSINLTNLVAGQTYYCQVQSVTSGGASSFSPSISFVAGTGSSGNTTSTPTGSLSIPSGLSQSNLTNVSAMLSWSPVSGAASYMVGIKPIGTSNWTTNTINDTYFSATGLSPNTTYEFQVQALDMYGNQSGYSPSASFQTTGVGLQKQSDVTGTGAVLLSADCSYGGQQLALQPGKYTQGQLTSMGFPDHSLSSINIPQGRSVQLFRNGNLTGDTVILSSDISCLTSVMSKSKTSGKKIGNNPLLSWNDLMSSIIVS